MLNLRSSLRRSLLAFFFLHIDGQFYVRELARRLEVDPTNLSRELKTLARQGIFSVEVRGREHYYKLNKKYPAFKELKGWLRKTIGLETVIMETFENDPQIQVVVLYGSFAHGREDIMSDVDLLIVGAVTLEDLADRLYALEHRLGREVNVSIYSSKKFKQNKNRDPLLKSIFAHDHTVLKESI